jgi:hypothetical protein
MPFFVVTFVSHCMVGSAHRIPLGLDELVAVLWTYSVSISKASEIGDSTPAVSMLDLGNSNELEVMLVGWRDLILIPLAR